MIMCSSSNRLDELLDGKKYYTVLWLRDGRALYRGSDLSMAADCLEPGTVYGSGPTQLIADAEAVASRVQQVEAERKTKMARAG